MPIPKIIHYCWLSGDPIPEAYQRCMDTWKTKLPDYRLMLWDTKNFDIHSTSWTAQSFEAGLYACAADYIRLYAVYTHGGIYLDMDMEVLKPFDDLLTGDLMLAYENHVSENIEAGCFGASKGHRCIKKCLEYFENRNFYDPVRRDLILGMKKSDRHEFINPLILPEIMRNALADYGEPVTINPRDYFTAKNVITGLIEQTERTYTIHHFATQYHSEAWRKQREREQRVRIRFGERSAASKIGILYVGVTGRIQQEGLWTALRYYGKKYLGLGDILWASNKQQATSNKQQATSNTSLNFVKPPLCNTAALCWRRAA